MKNMRKHGTVILAAGILTVAGAMAAPVSAAGNGQADPYGGNPTPATPVTVGGSSTTNAGAPGRVTTVPPAAPGKLQTGGGGTTPAAGTQQVVTGLAGRPMSGAGVTATTHTPGSNGSLTGNAPASSNVSLTTTGAPNVSSLPATGGGVPPAGGFNLLGLLLAAALSTLGFTLRRVGLRR